MNKTKAPSNELQMSSEPFEQIQHCNQAENKAYYKNQMAVNKRVIKTSRNLFNNEPENNSGEVNKDLSAY
jgi:hypothetical protein